jgi:hypothetical protein
MDEMYKVYASKDDVNNALVQSGNLPVVTTDNNGAFLRVVNGVWAVDNIPNAEEASF